MSTELETLQTALGYRFQDRATLLQALTHTSYGHEHFPKKPLSLKDNERLEFLGDAILDVIVSDILLETFQEATEGQLSKMRAAVVNEKTLAEIAKSLGIHKAVRLGKGETQSGGSSKPSILSSTLEAIIAAIYLDGGFGAAYPVVRHLFQPLFSTEGKQNLLVANDYKTSLQEIIQAAHKVTPTYHLLGTDGPDHAKVFEVEVRMNGQGLAVAKGSSKKEAEQAAANAALRSFET